MAKLFLALIALFILICYREDPEKMKKMRINIAPTIGIKEEFYVDVRFDKNDSIDIMECIENNCVNIQKRIQEDAPGVSGRWRVNTRVIDLVYDHYCVQKNT